MHPGWGVRTPDSPVVWNGTRVSVVDNSARQGSNRSRAITTLNHSVCATGNGGYLVELGLGQSGITIKDFIFMLSKKVPLTHNILEPSGQSINFRAWDSLYFLKLISCFQGKLVQLTKPKLPLQRVQACFAECEERTHWRELHMRAFSQTIRGALLTSCIDALPGWAIKTKHRWMRST